MNRTSPISGVLYAITKLNCSKHRIQVLVVYTSAPQPFLTCGTLIKLPGFGGTLQQIMSVTTQKMQKTILISKNKKRSSVWKPPISVIIEVISKTKKRSSGQKVKIICCRSEVLRLGLVNL